MPFVLFFCTFASSTVTEVISARGREEAASQIHRISQLKYSKQHPSALSSHDNWVFLGGGGFSDKEETFSCKHTAKDRFSSLMINLLQSVLQFNLLDRLGRLPRM